MIEMQSRNFGQYIDAIRRSRGVTQQELANLLGVSVKTMQRISSGEVDLRHNQYQTLRSYFGIYDIEVESNYEGFIGNFEVVDEMISRLYMNGDLSGLTDIDAQLREYAMNVNASWIYAERLIVAVFLSSLQDNRQSAQKYANEIFAHIFSEDQVSLFQVVQATHVARFLSLEKSKMIELSLTRLSKIGSVRHSKQYKIITADLTIANLFRISELTSAGAAQAAALALLEIDVYEGDIEFAILNLFSEALLVLFTDEETAEQTFYDVRALAQRFLSPLYGQVFLNDLERIWTRVVDLAQNNKTIQ